VEGNPFAAVPPRAVSQASGPTDRCSRRRPQDRCRDCASRHVLVRSVATVEKTISYSNFPELRGRLLGLQPS
jgi:hypothetical protein